MLTAKDESAFDHAGYDGDTLRALLNFIGNSFVGSIDDLLDRGGGTLQAILNVCSGLIGPGDAKLTMRKTNITAILNFIC